MKKIFALPVLCSLLMIVACKKDYYVDSGTHDPNFNGNIVQYLNSNPAYFDSLIKVVRLSGLDTVLSTEKVTFFAPPAQSIMKSVQILNRTLLNRGKDTVKRLEQIKPSVWKDMLSLYIIRDKYLLKDVPQLDTLQLQTFSGQAFISYGGRPMNIGVIYNSAGTVQYAGYRQLCYSYIVNSTGTTPFLINAPVASSDIQPTNGAVHVLQFYYHNFGFNANNFTTAAISAGIN